MEKNILIEYLAQIAPISEALKAFLNEELRVDVLPKENKLIRKDQLVDRTWFIVKGLAKSCYDDPNGKQIVTRFWKENETLLLKTKDLQNGPVRFSEEITLLEQTTLLSLHHNQIKYIYAHYPEIHEITRKIYLADIRKRDLRSRLLVMSATLAYEEFCLHFPCQRLRLQDIAYYLNIRPYSLSRIRAKLKRNP